VAVDRSFITLNRAARERLESAVGRLSDDDLHRELSDGWTVAAALAHVAFWDRRALVLVERWTKGEAPRPSPYDVDVANDAAHYLIRLLQPRDAADEALAAAIAIDRALENLDDGTLAAVQAIESPRVDRAKHRLDHLDEIELLLSNR
jgi:hypothetical protein